MANVVTDYASSTLSVGMTGAATLANATSGNSDAIDNTSSRYLDYLVTVTVTTASGATATGLVEIWVKGSIDGTTYEDDGNDRWIGTIVMAAAGVQTRRKMVSFAAGFNGPLPPYTKIRLRNVTGGALTDATATALGILAETV